MSSPKSTQLYRIQYTALCEWCKNIEQKGACSNDNNQELFDTNIKTLISRALPSLPIGVKLNITSYLNLKIPFVCYECSDFNIKFTKSGRVVKEPVKFSDIKFIPGSRIPGCDSFDFGYDSGYHIDNEKYLPDCHLQQFVVDDDDEELNSNLSDEEEEYNFDESSSDEESECDEWD
jgi:hypothetical protein